MFLEDQPNSWYFGFSGGHLMYILHMYTITAGLSVTKTQNPIKWIFTTYLCIFGQNSAIESLYTFKCTWVDFCK